MSASLRNVVFRVWDGGPAEILGKFDADYNARLFAKAVAEDDRKMRGKEDPETVHHFYLVFCDETNELGIVTLPPCAEKDDKS